MVGKILEISFTGDFGYMRFHDFRHPYVKHTTKIFILRLKVLQAQRDPDRRRKTCGAFRLHRKGLKAKLIEPILQ